MRRVLYMAREKTGSTFFRAMLMGVNGKFAGPKDPLSFEASIDVNNMPIVMKTTPACNLYPHTWACGLIIEDMIYARPVVDSPETYTWQPPGVIDPAFYQNFPNFPDWRFVYQFRDPRNRICGLMKRDQSSADVQHKIFLNECYAAKCEVESIQKMINHNQFYLMKFEEMIADPLNKVEEAFNFMGFQIDRDFYSGLIDRQVKHYTNTSFGDKGKGSNRRWDMWTDDQKEHYDKKLMPILRSFGYERYLKW